MLAGEPTAGPGKVTGRSEGKATTPRLSTGTYTLNEGGRSAADVGAALPDFTDVMHGVARMLRDVDALRYAVHTLIPEPERLLAARLIQRRYRVSARRARHILGLPPLPEVSP
jgi:hypothetical protein